MTIAHGGCAVGGRGAPSAEPLRVATSGDYAPYSVAPGEISAVEGFDPAVARLFARDAGRDLAWQRFQWPELLADLSAGRFDVAMSGITVRPERLVAGRFSIPVSASGAVLLVPASLAGEEIESLDLAETRIAVNAGGHLERVTRAHFRRARIRAIPDNSGVIAALADGTVDAAVSDTQEAPHWLARAPGFSAIGPFTRDRKAYLLPADAGALASRLDRWLLGAERDGRLAELRATLLRGDAPPRSADPLFALLASIDDRLSLMPFVAAEKQRRGLAIEAPEVEARVTRAATEAVMRAADEFARPPLPPVRVRAIFEALITAAKELQRETDASSLATRFDLEDELRPALIRIGERIAMLLLELPADLSAEEVDAAAQRTMAPARLAAFRAGGGAEAIAAATLNRE